MIWTRRILLALVGLAVLAVLGFNLFKTQIATRAFEQGVISRAGVDQSADLPDGLHLYLCGTGSPLPDPTRAGPCLGVLAGARAYVFDVGSGGARNLGGMGFPIDRIESVYLTHLHSDHIDGLGELLTIAWLAGSRASPLPVIGPTGTKEVVAGFNAAYRLDSTYRTAHHGVEVANPTGFGGQGVEILLPAGPGGDAIIFEDDTLKITAIRVEHAPVEPAFGYRIDYKDRSLSISGDTIYHPGFVAMSKGVDLMVHEALDPEMTSAIGLQLSAAGQRANGKIFADILDYHATPEQAAQAAQEAGAQELVYYHMLPPLPIKLIETVFYGDAKAEFDGPMMIGRDGVIISLPAGSDKITKSKGF
ncbi:MAG: MBL fold metallo-hydrolase [Pseudomonadota bacterium]